MNMRNLFAAFLLIPLTAVAQQTVKPSSLKAATSDTAATPQSPATSAPTNMDQVVDRTIQREHALMDFLKNRTPLSKPTCRICRQTRLSARFRNQIITSLDAWT